jgi:hypothetical protein
MSTGLHDMCWDCRQSGNRNSPSQLLKHRLSNNVGGVKHILSVPIPALRRARHFALVEDVPIQPRLARNQYSGLDSVRPMHLFDRNLDHDY